jgi:hypothetical protein
MWCIHPFWTFSVIHWVGFAQTLDADKKRLSGPDGRVAVRDIVQFMPMRNVARKYFLLNQAQARRSIEK